jgi:polysaccharide pyruvyl transferase WcaK-like protein
MLTAAAAGAGTVWSLTLILLCQAANKTGIKTKYVYNDCDVVIDLNVDALNEYYQGVFGPLFVLSNILQGMIAGKPVMVMAASIAPLESKLLKKVAKAILNRTKIITVREVLSKEHLKTLEITKPHIEVTADFAFLLDASSSKRVTEIFKIEVLSQNSSRIIGIAAAPKALFKNPDRFIQLMANISNELLDRFNASLLFIPNSSIEAQVYEIATIQEILKKVKTSERVKMIEGVYSEKEIKGVIMKCDIFISAKFHPLLVATSAGIPSIGLVGYHPSKFHGVIGEMMGQEESLIDLNNLNDIGELQKALMAKLDTLNQNKDMLRKLLEVRAAVAKTSAMRNGELLAAMVKHERT